MMAKMQLSYFVAVLAFSQLSGIVEAQKCSDYILDLCNLPEGQIITKVSVQTQEVCQKMCRLYSECQLWIFDSQLPESERCWIASMAPEDYVNTCMEIGGPLFPDIEYCLGEGNTDECSYFTWGNCNYPSNPLEVLPGLVTGPNAVEPGCDEACALRMNCVYWRYRYESDECVLYGSQEKTCNIQRGKPYPDIAECQKIPCPCPEEYICVGGFCERCETDDDCLAIQICVPEGQNGQNICRLGCRDPTRPCPSGVCNPDTLICEGCSKDDDCKDPAKPNCDTAAFVCRECVDSGDCGGATPVCYNYACVGCVDQDDCTYGTCINQTCTECKDDSECECDIVPGSGIWNTCNYCDEHHCVQGCQDDINCLLAYNNDNYFCSFDHHCDEKGSSTRLKAIIVSTRTCSGCPSSFVEGGIEVFAHGNSASYDDFLGNCTTESMDFADSYDYGTGGEVSFEDKDNMGRCYQFDFQGTNNAVRKISIMYNGYGEWTPEKIRFEYTVGEDRQSCCSNPTGLTAKHGESFVLDCSKCSG